MGGDSEGTPNPLNPNPGMTASTQPGGYAGTPAPVEPASFAQPVADVNNYGAPMSPHRPAMSGAPARPMGGKVVDPMMRRARPMPQAQYQEPAEPAATEQVATFESLTEEYIPEESDRASQSAYTTSRDAYTPAENAEPVMTSSSKSVVEPAGKTHKKWPIITAFVCFVLAVGCAVTAALIFLMPKPDDRVAMAISNLLDNGLPSIVKTDGEVNLIFGDESSELSLLNISFVSENDSKAKANSTTATVTATMRDDTDFSFDVDEIKMKSGDIYFKVSDMSNLLTDFGETNCIGDTTGETNCEADVTSSDTQALALMQGVFEIIDDQWILVEGDFIENIDSLGIFDNESVCLLGVVMNFSKYGTELGKKYEANPFITYSTEDLKIAQKKNNLYRIGIDSEKMAAFSNSLDGTAFISDLGNCVGSTTRSVVTSEDIAEVFSGMPTIYAEVDSENKFTRAYFDADIEGDVNVRADIDISYPAKMEITEPDEYITTNDLLTNVMNNFFGVETTEVEE